jgi:hypothetical protein
MSRKMETSLTEGSQYRIISIGGKDAVLETEGVFKGFSTLGIDEIGLLMEMGSFHGDQAGRIRIVPLHAILAIDVIDAIPQDKKDDSKETSQYFG